MKELSSFREILLPTKRRILIKNKARYRDYRTRLKIKMSIMRKNWLQQIQNNEKRQRVKKRVSFYVKQFFRFKEIMADRAKEVMECQMKIRDLEQEKKQLLDFTERKRLQQQKVEELLKQIDTQKAQHQHNIQLQDQTFAQERQRKEKDASQDIARIQQIARENAEQNMKQSQQTKKENMKLKDQLLLHQRELEELKQERDEIARKNQSFLLSIEGNKEGIEEHQSNNHKQANKIKKLKEKIKFLETFIDEEISQYTDEIQQTKQRNKKEAMSLEYELRSLEEQMKKRTKETKNLRSLCQMILDQRSDIQHFFLEAVQQVKHEKTLKKLKSNQNNGMNGSNFPDLSSQFSPLDGSRMSIAQLELEEREKVLRLVFSKMNSGLPPQPWRLNMTLDTNSNVNNNLNTVNNNTIPFQHDDSHMRVNSNSNQYNDQLQNINDMELPDIV